MKTSGFVCALGVILAALSGCAGLSEDEDAHEPTATVNQASITCSAVSEHSWCSGSTFYNRVQYRCTHTSGETWVESRLYGGYESASCRSEAMLAE